MKVTLNKPISMFFRSGIVFAEIPLSEVHIHKIAYYPDQKVAYVELKEMPGNDLILWEGAEYDAAGDWTDADTVARIKEEPLLDKIQAGPHHVPKKERDDYKKK